MALILRHTDCRTQTHREEAARRALSAPMPTHSISCALHKAKYAQAHTPMCQHLCVNICVSTSVCQHTPVCVKTCVSRPVCQPPRHTCQDVCVKTCVSTCLYPHLSRRLYLSRCLYVSGCLYVSRCLSVSGCLYVSRCLCHPPSPPYTHPIRAPACKHTHLHV